MSAHEADHTWELLNPAELFNKIMVDYSYPECTTAVLASLSLFRQCYPTYRTTDIQRTIKRTTGFIEHSQRADGSWYGSWATCFTYAIFFALESLVTVGRTYAFSERVRKLADSWLSIRKPMVAG